MVAIKHELDTVQQVKEEIEELREYVDRLEEHTQRRKLRLLEQVNKFLCSFLFLYFLKFYIFLCYKHKIQKSEEKAKYCCFHNIFTLYFYCNTCRLHANVTLLCKTKQNEGKALYDFFLLTFTFFYIFTFFLIFFIFSILL